jgi:ABC-type multidrug transport system ATPase subunit
MDALRMDQVHKRYGRGKKALDGLSCRFPMGSICGLVGPNGAGKTTAFSVVSGYLRPDTGSVDILDVGAFDAHRLKGRIGVLPQDAVLPDRHTPRELLVHCGRLQGLGAAEAQVESARILKVVRLGDRENSRISSLSHGMRRRVAVASALMGSPELVLLDEPLAGLDPVQAHSLRDALKALRGVQTLVISSHNLSELERMCDWVVMMADGRCLRQGTLAEVTGQTSRVEWVVLGEVPLERLRAALPGHMLSVEADTLIQESETGTLDESSIQIMSILSEAGVPVKEVRRGISLERRFIDETEAPK